MSEKLIGKIATPPKIQGNIKENSLLQGKLRYGSYELNSDYNRLANKPQIEGVELIDNKTFKELGALSLSNMEIENLINMQI